MRVPLGFAYKASGKVASKREIYLKYADVLDGDLKVDKRVRSKQLCIFSYSFSNTWPN